MDDKRIVIASDIHGSAFYCKKLIDRFENENADVMLLLGDLLYHGPRNALPQEYDCPSVIDMLNGIKEKIVCVRGNCDSEVDQMVLEFDIKKDHKRLWYRDRTIFATHGHIYNIYHLPELAEGDILLTGHTHVPACDNYEDCIYCNPGSVSIPKMGSNHSYILLCDGRMVWKDLDGNAYMQYDI